MPLLPLFGRERELGVLDDLVDRVGESGGALVVCGEPGVGKSALLAAARARVNDGGMLVLTAAGVQSEAHLPFAGLHQLLRPVLDRAEDLPARQRVALLAAFGMTDATAPDLFMIGLAALELLADAAAGSRLLVCVDDAQWLDRPTGDVLAFVARRLESEPIVLLAAIREGYESPLVEAGLMELRLEGLDRAAAGALLDAHAPDLGQGVRERLLEEAVGNPLALIELPVALEADQLDGGALLPERLPLTARLERALAARVSELPATTRTVLLIAAVDDGDALAEVVAAATIITGVDVTVEALTPAVAAQLVEADEMTVRFRHPLVRSAVQQAAGVWDRQRAHAALVQVLAGEPDRRAWHRAAASVGPDEEAAGELEQMAARAQRRGAIAVAVVALERAATLSGDPERRAGWLLRAAELAVELGRRDLVDRLLRQAEPLELGSLDRGRLLWIQEMVHPSRLGDADSVGALVEAADRVAADGDKDLALNLLWLAGQRCFWADPGEAARASVIAAAQRVGSLDADADQRLLGILAYAAPIEHGRVVFERLVRAASDGSEDAGATRLLGSAALVVGAFDLSARFLGTAGAGLRSQGRLGHLARVLVQQAWSAVHLGDWKVAMPAAEEASRLAAETKDPMWAAGALVVKATLMALRGDEVTANVYAAEAEQALPPIGASFILAIVQLARGLSALGAGRSADAYEQLRRMFDPTDPAYHPSIRCWAVGEFAEAAVRSGHRDEALAVAEELLPLAARTPSPWFQAGLRYAQALLADDADAEGLFQSALEADLARWPLARARLLLAYGVWLRRQRRVAESRAPLRVARDAFDALGAVVWGERARQELRASGETSRRRTPGAWDRLSPQELQIAQLAASGLSNREIGQQLYLSHRTVSSHLYRVFPKLGISSRAQLRGLLDGGPAVLA